MRENRGGYGREENGMSLLAPHKMEAQEGLQKDRNQDYVLSVSHTHQQYLVPA